MCARARGQVPLPELLPRFPEAVDVLEAQRWADCGATNVPLSSESHRFDLRQLRLPGRNKNWAM